MKVYIVTNKIEELYVKFDEKDQVGEASKTRQNAEYMLTATTCVYIINHNPR